MSKNEKGALLRRVAVGSAIGAAVTLAMSVLMLMFIALLVASGKIGEGAERSIVVACAFISAAVGALIARIKNKGAAFISGVGTAMLAVMVRLLAGLISDGIHAFDGADIAVCLAILCGGLASGAVTFKRRRRRR